MTDLYQLEKLRPLGKLEQVSAACHHLGFFNNVGLSAHYRLNDGLSLPAAPELRRVLLTAVGEVARKHRILSAIPVNEDSPDCYFASLASINLNRSILFLKRHRALDSDGNGEDPELDAILEEQHNTNFKSEYGTLPYWRLVVLEDPGEEVAFTASFIYHHAIGDGVSGLVFHRALREALETALASPSDATPEETLVMDSTAIILPPMEQLHPLPTNPAPSPPAATLEEWTGNSIRTPCKSRWASVRLPASVSETFFARCKAADVSVTSALASIIASELLRILPSAVEALTCIVPVSLRPWLELSREAANGAIGTYFDATKVRFERPCHQDSEDRADIWPGARKASKAMSDYLTYTSPSGEPYTAIAPLKSIPDVSLVFRSLVGNPRDAAFEVTNVGRFSSPANPMKGGTPRWQVGETLLSRSSVVTGAAVTVSVATGENGSMAVGFSWQDGAVDEKVVQHVRDGVKEFFRKT